MRIRPFILLIVFGLGGLLAGCEGLAGEPIIVSTTAPQSLLDTSLAQDDIAAVMTLGGEVWMGNCAECHGQNGLGTEDGAPLPDLTDYTDEQILASITNGKSDEMPAFGDELTPDELAAAMTYAKMMSLARARGMLADAGADVAEADIATETIQTVPDAASVLGVVNGRVTNGTTDAGVPASLLVTLHVIKSEFEEQAVETPVAADGAYQFADVPFDASYQYVVTAAHSGVMFVSEIITVDPAQTEIRLPVTIYETGAPESVILISTISTQLMVQNDVLQAIQIVSFINTSDQVYYNADEESATSVHLNLPQNASLLSSVSSRNTLSEDGRQIYSTRPVMPGETYIMHLAYSMPYEQPVSIDQMLDYPLDGNVDVVVATQNLTLAGDGFGEPQQATLGDIPVASYSAQMQRDAGTRLVYDISGSPAPVQIAANSTSNATSPIAYVLIGAGISAFLIAGLIALRERLRSRPTHKEATIGDLLEQIAVLDKQQAEGKLSAGDYKRIRTELKAQLSTLMKSQ